ncbi:enolase C-terminal domain-like protein [Shumkonia mesophila]|uniref:enolase C-terminal domain-like protein n=1 Tax=Shumkonia mesophila TaxID=2838854 RepID=UPI00293511F5|nr:enolase C-terminal domain-like protein [Shumkonia mesophila]
MKIASIKPFPVQGPVSDLCYIKVETDEGIVGYGECSLPGKPNGVAGAVRDLEPLLVGADPTDTEWCWQRVYRHSYWRGGPILTSALSGVDVALWDIRGKVAGLPVYKLLGGAVRTRVRLYANLGLSEDPNVFRSRVREAKALGYKTVKIYPLPPVGPVVDFKAVRGVVACCEAVRDELGDMDFAVDFHAKLSWAGAIVMESAIRHTAPLWIEEPAAAESPQDLRRCVERFSTPIAVGERLFTRWGFRAILEEQLAGIIQPDVSNGGGITELWKIAAMAETYGVAFNPHNPNGPLQVLASLHLAASAQAFGMLEHRHEDHDVFAKISGPLVKVEADGCCGLPGGPGLGGAFFLDGSDEPILGKIHECFRPDGSIGDW